jgi:hypothetical protein
MSTTNGIFVDPFTGNVGIGTSQPLNKLYVQGDLIISNALTLYLLATPLIHEWQYVGGVTSTVKITYNFGTAVYPKAVYADVYTGGSSSSDHQNIILGKNHSDAQNWTNGRNIQPSTAFGNQQRQVVTLTISGELDNFSSYYGVWHSSQIIPIESNGQLYFSNYGNSGSSGWIYVVTRGYYL